MSSSHDRIVKIRFSVAAVSVRFRQLLANRDKSHTPLAAGDKRVFLQSPASAHAELNVNKSEFCLFVFVCFLLCSTSGRACCQKACIFMA